VLPLVQNSTTSGFSSDLSDTEGGLLQTVYIITYMIMSPIFGYFGDRVSRKAILLIGIVIWSIAGLASSFSPDYAVLMLCRAVVGVGEASYATVSPTIIADLYNADARGLVISIYYVAIPLGTALGYVLGSELAAAFGSWRWAFRITPGIGLLLGIVQYFFIVEPERGASEGDGHHHHHSENSKSGMFAFFGDWSQVWKARSFTWSTLGFTMVTFASGALAQWAPTLLTRQIKHTPDIAPGYDNTKISLVFGAITCATGILGTLLGSVLSKMFMRKYGAADGIVCSLGMLCSLPFLGLTLYLSDGPIARTWALLAVGEMFLFTNWGPCAALLLYVVPPSLRSTAEGAQTLVSHLFGDAFSPFLVGGISDALHDSRGIRDSDSIEYALYLTVLAVFLGSIFFALSCFYIVADRAAADQAIAQTEESSPLLDPSGQSTRKTSGADLRSFVRTESSL
jgi:MFS transporter, Spinster family, sphingosine-1-phosphate transporter